MSTRGPKGVSRRLPIRAKAALLAASVMAAPAVSRASLSFYVDPTSPWPGGWYNAAVADMQTVVNMYNAYGDFGNGTIDVYYNAGIPTEQSGYGGWGGSIGVGGTYPNVRVLLHESSHWLGTGTYSNYWSGPHAAALIQQFDGVGAVLNGDTQHYWPYGENYDSESSPINDARHVAMVYALREDFGIGSTAPPSSARNVTLIANDAVGTSGFNYPWGWSDGHFVQPGTNYSTGSFALRTPNGYPSWTFVGDSLTVNAGGRLLFNGWGTTGVVTINNLVLAGGTISHDQAAQDLFQLAGHVNLTSASTINAANGNINVLADIRGAGSLVKTGSYALTLTAPSTYTGSTLVSAGTLALAGGGSINNSSGITVNGPGARLLQTGSVPLTAPVTLTNGTLDGIGTVGSVTVEGNPANVVTNGNGVAGALMMASLNFQGAGTDTVRIAGGSAFNSPGQMVAGPLTTPVMPGAVTVNVAAQGLVNGTYDLMQYGSLAGGGASAFTLGTVASLGNHQAAALAADGSSLTLTVGGDLDRFTAADGNAWRVGSTGANHNFNLSTAGTAIDYTDRDAVLFDDSAATGSVNLASNVAPAWTNFNNSSRAYTITSAGGFGITGTGGITKNGSGTVTLSTANSYSGATVINAGTLAVAANNALGADAAPVVLNGGTLQTTAGLTSTHPLTVAAGGGTIKVATTGAGGTGQLFFNTPNMLTGSGSLTLVGNGTLTTTGAGNLRVAQTNPYSGTLTVTSGGIFEYGVAGALAPAATFNVANQGEVAVQGATATSMSDAISVTGGTNSVLSFENGTLGDAAGPITLNANLTVALRDWYNHATVRGGTIDGRISGAGGLVVNSGSGSGGMLTLSDANTYSGGTTLTTSTLLAGNSAALGTGALNMNSATLGSTAAVTIGNRINVAASNTIGYAGQAHDITLAGGLSGGGTLSNFVGSSNNYNLFLAGNLSGFTGTLNYTCDANAATGWWRVGANNAVTDLSHAAVTIHKGNVTDPNAVSKNFGFTDGISGATVRIGSLSGDGVFQASFNNAGRNTLEVGGLNTDATFSGVIGGGNAGTNINVNKVGTGTWTLSGASPFTGNVLVNGGTLSAASAANVSSRTSGPLGNPSAPGRTVTINSGGTVALVVGNVLGSDSQATAPPLSFVVNAGGLLKTAAGNVGGPGGGDANILGNITLNGGTLATGNGYSAAYQAAILLGNVSVGGTSPSVINSNATNTVANGVMLATPGGTTFNVAATGAAGPDLIVSAPVAGALNGAPGSLIKTGVGTLDLASPGGVSLAAITASAGAITIGGTSAVTGPLTLVGPLTINGSASVRLLEGGITTNSVTQLTISGAGTLDLSNNSLHIHFGANPDPSATIAGYIAGAFHAGAWDAGGIRSSALDANHGVGLAEDAPGDLLVAPALYGDANLDGSVNFTDLLDLAQHYGQTNATWDQGDFNYDGSVGFSDLLSLAQHYGQPPTIAQLGTFSPNFRANVEQAFAAVPEPASAAILLIAAPVLIRPRRPA